MTRARRLTNRRSPPDRVPDSPTVILAFAAGFVSFVSPCCLPLMPGYLAVIGRTGPARADAPRIDVRLFARSLVFVASFPAVFILLGLSATLGGYLRASSMNACVTRLRRRRHVVDV